MRQICKRGLSVVLALALMVSLLTFGASASEYADMPTGWSHAAMEAAVDNGLLQGNNGKLDPEGLLTRAQLATVVTRAFGATAEADLASYTDVKANDWYASALAKALAMGVMNGTSAAAMSPEQYVTRQEVFVILARAMQLEDGTAEDLAAFTDAASVSAWAVGGTAAMVKSGCIKGSDGLLQPQERITREQFAQILYNIFAAYYREAGTYTGDVEGSLMISAPDVTVKNATIHGDLVIGDGVGEGDVTLDNVTVEGRVVVRGGGVNSIHIFSSRVGTIVVSKANGNVRIAADNASSILVIYVADGRDDVVIEGKVDTVVVEGESTPVVLNNATVNTVQVNADKAEVSLTGRTKVTEVAVSDKAEGVQLNTEKSTSVGTLTANTDVTVDNSGSIGAIKGEGTTTDKKGEEVTPAPAPSTGGGHRHSYAAEWTTDETHHWHIATCSHTEQKGSYGEHKYDIVVSDTATCTEAGTRVMSCVCGKTVEEASPAKGHAFSEEWSSDATDHWHASTCGHDLTTEKVPHTWNDGKVTTAAKCDEAGVMTYTCTACGATKTEPIAALGHDFTTRYSKDANGHWHVCSRCDATDEVTPHTYPEHDCDERVTCTECGYKKSAGEHAWGEGVVTTAATCTEKGVMTYTCTVCGDTKTEPIAALGHDFTTAYSKDANGHWHVCSRCDATDKAVAHSYDKKTCDEAASCTVCGYVKPAGEHTWNDGKVTTKATCDEAGVMTYTCTACGATKTEPIAALGHDFTTRYSKDANGHWHVCSRCDATDEVVPHTYPEHDCDERVTCTECGYKKSAGEHAWGEGVVTTAATCTEKGVMTYTCTICGDTKTEPIAATGHTPDSFWTYGAIADKHYKKCTTCGEIAETAAHSFDPTTNKCVCGAEQADPNAVTNIYFGISKSDSNDVCLTWTHPTNYHELVDTYNPFFYCIYLREVGSDEWSLRVTMTPWNNYVTGRQLAGQGTFDAVKVATGYFDENDEYVTLAETVQDISLTVTNVSSAASVSFNANMAVDTGKWDSYPFDVAITGATPNASGTLWIESASKSYNIGKDVIFDENGNAETRVELDTGWLLSGHWYYAEYSNAKVSEDGMTASYTARFRGDDIRDTLAEQNNALPCVEGVELYVENGELWYKPYVSDTTGIDHWGIYLYNSETGNYTTNSGMGLPFNDQTVYFGSDVYFDTVAFLCFPAEDDTEHTISVARFDADITYTMKSLTSITSSATWSGDDLTVIVNGCEAGKDYFVGLRDADETKSRASFIQNGKITFTDCEDYFIRYKVYSPETTLGNGLTATVTTSVTDWNAIPEKGATPSTPDTPDTPDVPTGEYTLAYAYADATDYRNGLLLTFSPALPATTGEYQLRFYNANGKFTNTFKYADDCSELDHMFAGNNARTFTRVELSEIVGGTETLLARLDKSLTTAYSGTAINVTGVNAVDSDDGETWDVTLTVDTTLDSSKQDYVLLEEHADGDGSCGYIWFENGKICTNFYKEEYTAGETVKLYLMKVTRSIDADGNATLTYTPMGDGYSWTVPSDTNAVTNIHFTATSDGDVRLAWDAPANYDELKSAYGKIFYRVYLRDKGSNTWDGLVLNMDGYVTCRQMIGGSSADCDGVKVATIYWDEIEERWVTLGEAEQAISFTVTEKTGNVGISAFERDEEKSAEDGCLWFKATVSGATPNEWTEFEFCYASNDDCWSGTSGVVGGDGTFGVWVMAYRITAENTEYVYPSDSDYATYPLVGDWCFFQYSDVSVSSDGLTVSYTITSTSGSVTTSAR